MKRTFVALVIVALAMVAQAQVQYPPSVISVASPPTTCYPFQVYSYQAGSALYVSGAGNTCVALVSGGTAANVPWSGLTAPTAALSLSMPPADTTIFTWTTAASPTTTNWTWTAAADSGTSTTPIFVFDDTTGNTRTGPLLDIHSVGTSTALPVRITGQGTANGVSMDHAGLLAPMGSGAIYATQAATTSTSAASTFYPLFVASSSNSYQAPSLNSGFTYNPSTGNLTATSFNSTFLIANPGNYDYYVGISQSAAGTGNTGMGYGALYAATAGGNYNVEMGFQTGNSGTTASYMTALGSSALRYITTASYNTGVGGGAGEFITGGSTPNITSANSTYLGYNTEAAADADTNETVIGYAAVGAGSNTAVIGNGSVTNVYLGSAGGLANLHAAGVTASGTATLNGEVTGPGHWTTQVSSGATQCGSATFSGTNWSGSGFGPWTHSSGTTALTSASCTALVAGQSYLLTYSMVAGGGGTVTSSFGGLTGSANTTTGTYTQYGTASGTTALAFTPSTGFTGTVTFVSLVLQGPKATSCGTPVIVQGSTDRAGKLTTAVSGCVVTFQTAYTNAPSCDFKPDVAVTGDASQSVSNSSLTVTATGMTAFDYQCIGLNE